MQLAAGVLNEGVSALGLVLVGGLTGLSLFGRKPWPEAWGRAGFEGDLLGLLAAGLVPLWLIWLSGSALLWELGFPLSEQVFNHVLLLNSAVLMFGWRWALLGGLAVLLVRAGLGLAPWETLGVNAVSAVLVPVAVAHLVLRASERWLPPNFFIYVFIPGFFAAGVGALAGGTLLASLLALGGKASAMGIYGEVWPLLIFPEALVNGLLITSLVAVRPQWVRSFDDAHYLQGR